MPEGEPVAAGVKGTLEAFHTPNQRERAVVDLLLADHFPGAVELREQARTMTVQTNCTCGCDSFTIRTSATSPVPDEESPQRSAWNPELGVELWLELSAERRLSLMEITYLDPAHPPSGIPDLQGFSVVDDEGDVPLS